MNQDTNKPQSPGDGAQKSAYPLDHYTASPRSSQDGDGEKSPYYHSAAPSVSLPKGGGALKGIDEKFTVNAVNGTAALQVALPLTPGRGGFTPSLSLQYNSGSGNTEFGLGWGLGLPAIQRKTDKKLPRYNDAVDSDIFLLAGAEDLVPMLDDNGDPVTTPLSSAFSNYKVKRYRPRIEGLFARIEHITEQDTAGSWWRVTTKDNVVTYYGLTDEGRVSDPTNSKRIFKWLPQLSIDDKGNVQQYTYLTENDDNILRGAHEYNRLGTTFANKYLKNIRYCNLVPYFIPANDILSPSLPSGFDFLMEGVLDYGDHGHLANNDNDYKNPTVTPSNTWEARKDPFSDFHAGFEIRTYRKCRRVLMFHYFRELNAGNTLGPVLVRSLDMAYHHDTTNDIYAEADYITSITQAGYKKLSTGYFKKTLPALTLNYHEPVWDNTIHEVSEEDSKNAPQGFTGPYQWIDLWGEGLPGILSEQGNGWFYKANYGDGHFGRALEVAPKPSFQGLGSVLQWQDLDANGRRQVVSRDTAVQGYFELDDDQKWQFFRAFKNKANVDWNSPYTKLLDLDGDGRPDLLVTDDTIWTWYENKGKDGFEKGGASQTHRDEEKGPRLLLNDQLQSIFLADMNGDGITDIVRIKNGEVCYWPNMGYGYFGKKVAMSNAPTFDRADSFNPLYLTLADISGTGAADIMYLGKNECTAFINLAGNAWSEGTVISPLPGIDPYSKIAVMDFLGNGTGCIVWSSPLPQYSNAPMRYIDLMSGKKPYLLSSYGNGMGKEVTLTYKSSSKYYKEDAVAGLNWATRLPFPVNCVSKIITSDAVSETSYTQLYTYHHGYYDHEEREFRGFGRVDTLDTDVANPDTANELDQPPVLTKTWYHTGAWMRASTLLSAFETEYHQPGSWPVISGLADLPDGLSSQETREAYRALKGLPLRQEIYAVDGTASEDKPYTVTAYGYSVKLVQHLFENRFASFLSHQQQQVVYHSERNDSDPRVLHDLTLETDDYGNVVASAQVAYGRAVASLYAEQSGMLITYSRNSYTNDLLDDGAYYRLRMPCQVKTYQVHHQYLPFGANIWSVAALKTVCENAAVIQYSDDPESTANQTAVVKRLLSCSRVLYADNTTLSNTTITTTPSPLPLGTVDSLALEYSHYQLAFDSIDTAYDSLFDNTTAAEGGYVINTSISSFPSSGSFLDTGISETGWLWVPSGIIAYSVPFDSFFTPVAFYDPWDNETSISYWSDYYLLPETIVDALGNTTHVLSYDWRCLQPSSLQDPNLNQSEILYDALCMPVAMAMNGKLDSSNIAEADALDGIDVEDATDISYQQALIDNGTNAKDLLGAATWRCVYDMDVQPTVVAMIAREQHYSQNPDSLTLLRYTYSDGMSRVAMHKLQAADDPVTNDERWIGSGKTVYNNKGKAVMQFEPYYSDTHTYDPSTQALLQGVSPVMHYDPLGRLERTDMPDGSYNKTVWDAWQETIYDNNDTVLDSDWYTANTGGTTEQGDAASKAAAHNDTPTLQYMDVLGRTFYTRQYMVMASLAVTPGIDYFESFVSLDIAGNRLSITDARGLTSLTYRYNMLKAVAMQVSMDGGTQYMLTDVAGQPLYAIDPDGRLFNYTYDELRRPLSKTVNANGTTKTLEVMEYGDGQASPEDNNLRGKLYKSYDGAGSQQVAAYDFKGNSLSTERTYTTAFNQHPDWTTIGSVSMESGSYLTSMTYDALNRPVTITTPDTGVTTYTYEKTGLMYSVSVDSVHGLSSTIVISIDYDAKGQRMKIKYGNGSNTKYEYDPNSFRITRILTTRNSDSAILQDLNYWYDPVGNITKQKDNAQQSVYYNGTVADPHNNYTYDTLYRLIIAQGREHEGNGNAVNYSDSSRMGFTPAQVSSSDTAKMRRYTQTYEYDAVGNMLSMRHTVSGGGWTRDFTIDNSSNRLTDSSIGSNSTTSESYTYDSRGNMTAGFNHLTSMEYNEENRLETVVDASGNITSYYQYDCNGQRVRKVVVDSNTSITKSRKYIGQWEVFDKVLSSTLELQRETLHVMDDKARIALIDSPTVDTNSTAEVQTLRYQYSNHLDTAALELDDSAAIISYEEYFPYGSTSFQSGRSLAEVSLKRYRYTGKERDEETGLCYHGARYYAPWLASWMAVDPKIDKYFTWTSYNYALNNPIKFNDLDGKDVMVNIDPEKGIITLSSTIFVVGKNNGEMASDLNNFVRTHHDMLSSKEPYLDQNGKKWSVKLDIKYVAGTENDVSRIEQEVFQEKSIGNNILYLNSDKRPVSSSEVNDTGGNVQFFTFDAAKGHYSVAASFEKASFRATLNTLGKGEEISPGTGFHETLHLLGLSDWYNTSDDSSGNRGTSPISDEFKKDIMAGGFEEVNQAHWNNWIRRSLQLSELNKGNNFNMNIYVETDNKGNLIDANGKSIDYNPRIHTQNNKSN